MNTASKIEKKILFFAAYLQNQREKMNESAGSDLQTTKECAVYCLENDPSFFNWILPSGEFAGDYGAGATDEQKEFVKNFIEQLENY